MTRKEALWLACKQKTCCYAPFVIPTGRDIWRIARTLQTPPWSFLMYFQASQPRRDAFLLDGSGRQFRLALGKHAGRGKAPPPCVFLLRTRNGHHRCGLGELRPLVCRAFPAELVDDVLCLLPASGCTCRTWALADVDIAEETELVERRQADAEEYCALVGRWNANVTERTAGGGEGFTFMDYCSALLEAYDALAAPAVAAP